MFSATSLRKWSKTCHVFNIFASKCTKTDVFFTTSFSQLLKTCRVLHFFGSKCIKTDGFVVSSFLQLPKTCRDLHFFGSKCIKTDGFVVTSFLQLLEPFTFCHFLFPNVQNTTCFWSLPFHFLWNAARFGSFCSQMSKNRNVFPHFREAKLPKTA